VPVLCYVKGVGGRDEKKHGYRLKEQEKKTFFGKVEMI